jgi:diguanylate cyclase (GGDEF)-like protein
MTETPASAGHPALTDAQTGLPNRLHWDTVFGTMVAAGERGIPLTLLFLELSPYPAWCLGKEPEEVDRAFALIGQALGSSTRQSDLSARTQEDRFAFLLLDCNLAGGRLVADRLDAILESVRRTTGLGFNMGVAAHKREMKRPEELVGAAEEALRTAQARGVNQIEIHG